MNQLKEILRRINRRDFSGNEGKAIKNSTWQIITTLVAKIGALLFTIIIARLMLPEIYGLYGLAISTILFIGVFSDFGISNAILTFLSKKIDKAPAKAKSYFYVLTKYKIYLLILTSIILVASAKWFAVSYYNKPIYYALLIGVLYLAATIFSRHFVAIFTSKNDFKPQLIREIIIQISRLVIIPLAIIYFLSKTSSTEIYLLWIFILLSICYALGGIYILIIAKKRHLFKETKPEKLTPKEKQELKKFIIPLSATALSGIFFSYIDKIMLGHYVESQFVGFYQASFNLIASASAIIAFSSFALFPIFARLKGTKLERGLKKTRKITFLVSLAATIFTFIAAPVIIKIIYGNEYLTSISYLQILSLLLITFPLIKLYTSYYISQKRTAILSTSLIISTIINIGLNFLLINIGLTYSMFHAVTGACVATILARASFLAMLVVFRKRSPSIKNETTQ